MIDYSEIKALNWSTLKYMHTSPKLCRLRVDEPREDSDALQLGRAIHCAVFEPARWTAAYATEPDFGPQLTKDGKPAVNARATAGYKAQLAAWTSTLPPGTEVLDGEVYTTAERCARAVREHRIAPAVLSGGRFEEVLQWSEHETGVACKGRLDGITPRHVTDLKSTRRETTRSFLRDAEQLLYHGQLAWYHDGAVAAGRLPPDAERPYVISVQTSAPYDVAVYQLTERTLETGRRLYGELLTRYLECQAADLWPGIAPDLLEWDVSQWAAGSETTPEQEGW